MHYYPTSQHDQKMDDALQQMDESNDGTVPRKHARQLPPDHIPLAVRSVGRGEPVFPLTGFDGRSDPGIRQLEGGCARVQRIPSCNHVEIQVSQSGVDEQQEAGDRRDSRVGLHVREQPQHGRRDASLLACCSDSAPRHPPLAENDDFTKWMNKRIVIGHTLTANPDNDVDGLTIWHAKEKTYWL